jgi:hypothetical protein
MVESLPSQGMPARDPDHPTSSGEPVGDRDDLDPEPVDPERPDPERADETSDVDRLAAEIEALAKRSDPVPDEVVEQARAAFRARKEKKSVGPRGSSGRDRG